MSCHVSMYSETSRHKNAVSNGEQEKECECESGTEKPIPLDHPLSLLWMPNSDSQDGYSIPPSHSQVLEFMNICYFVLCLEAKKKI